MDDRNAMAPIAWDRVTFTGHMVEAAALVAECHVAFDFEGHEQTAYEVKVFRVRIHSSKWAVHARSWKLSALSPKPRKSTMGAGSSSTPGVLRATSASSVTTRCGSVP